MLHTEVPLRCKNSCYPSENPLIMAFRQPLADLETVRGSSALHGPWQDPCQGWGLGLEQD